jgi:transposase-like protein
MNRQRRKLSAPFKAKVSIEALKERKTVSELTAEFEVHPTQVSSVKREFLERNASVFDGEIKNWARCIKWLETDREDAFKQIGRLSLGVAWLIKLT